MRRLMIAALVGVGLTLATPASPAEAKPTKPGDAKILYSTHGRTEQEAYWALSWNHPGVVVCVTKGERAEAVYKISLARKRWPKKGYYWGGEAGRKWDRACSR